MYCAVSDEFMVCPTSAMSAHLNGYADLAAEPPAAGCGDGPGGAMNEYTEDAPNRLAAAPVVWAGVVYVVVVPLAVVVAVVVTVHP